MPTSQERQPRSEPQLANPAWFSAANRRRLSSPGLRSFAVIGDLWGLSEHERLLVLGLPARSTYHGWLKAAREYVDVTLPFDTLMRISFVLGIHKALLILFDTEAQRAAWLRTPHHATLFDAQPPLSLVTSGTQDGILAVRRFLDAVRGGKEANANFVPCDDEDGVFT